MHAKSELCRHRRECNVVKKGLAQSTEAGRLIRPRQGQWCSAPTSACYLGIDFGTSGARICAIDGIFLCLPLAVHSCPACGGNAPKQSFGLLTFNSGKSSLNASFQCGPNHFFLQAM